jgi:hypothetical protein
MIPEDCSDGEFCNGVERCIAGDCFMGDPVDCDDGNACTIDACDPVENGCIIDLAPGCDGGTVGFDGGTPCDAFDPGSHYTGTFRLLPAQRSDCGAFSFSISEVTLSVSGGALRISAGPATLVDSPAPTDASFDASGSGGCGNFELSGTFSCADRFTGTFGASPTAACGSCSTINMAVAGIRR